MSFSSNDSLLPSPALGLSSDEEGHEALFELQDSPKGGLGLFAVRKIPSGTCILSEDPIISMSRTLHEDQEAIESAFSALPKDDRKQYRKLFDAEKSRMSQVVSIYYSNCYNKDDFSYTSSGSPAVGGSSNSHDGGSCIGFLASRINHSCVPNVSFSYLHPSPSHPMGRMQFYAIKDIPRGKELFANYEKAVWVPHKQRQQTLGLHYGFECTCEACCPSSSFWQESDPRRIEMYSLMRLAKRAEKDYTVCKNTDDGSGSSEVIRHALETLTRLAYLMVKERLAYKPLANVYASLAKWAGRNRRRADERIWKQKELEICVTCFGAGSGRAQEVERQLAAANRRM